MPAEKARQILDCRGLLCPLPIFRLSRAIRGIQVGEVLELLATDPGSVPDMRAFQAQTGHEILASEQEGRIYRFLVKRTR